MTSDAARAASHQWAIARGFLSDRQAEECREYAEAYDKTNNGGPSLLDLRKTVAAAAVRAGNDGKTERAASLNLAVNLIDDARAVE